MGYDFFMARKNNDYDLCVVGGGSTGLVAGNVAGALGARVALIEKGRIGGECLWTGCVPSKALLHVAATAQAMRNGQALGLKNIPLSRNDCAGAFDYVREKIAEVRVNDATEKMLHDFGVDVFFGTPEIVRPDLIRTPGGDIRASHLLIATGSSPVHPDIPGLKEIGYLTNVTLFDLTAVPESLVIIGGGYIAAEMGQALSRLGSKVTLIQRDARLLAKDDAELTDLLTDHLRGEGITIHLNAEAVKAERTMDNQKMVTVREAGGAETTITASEILAAVGRKANTDNLNLPEFGVTLDKAGSIVVDDAGRTSVPNIWAAGDVTGKYQFSHMAEHEAKIVIRNILFPGTQKVPYDIVPWATFTSPELARVGLTEKKAKEKHGAKNVQIHRHSFRQDDRAIVENSTTGVVKIITTGLNGNIVGAHILGPRAGELIHEWVLAMRHNLPIRAVADLIHVYPTLAVSNQRAAQRWYSGVQQQPLVKGALSTIFGFHPRDPSEL